MAAVQILHAPEHAEPLHHAVHGKALARKRAGPAFRIVAVHIVERMVARDEHQRHKAHA